MKYVIRVYWREKFKLAQMLWPNTEGFIVHKFGTLRRPHLCAPITNVIWQMICQFAHPSKRLGKYGCNALPKLISI